LASAIAFAGSKSDSDGTSKPSAAILTWLLSAGAIGDGGVVMAYLLLDSEARRFPNLPFFFFCLTYPYMMHAALSCDW
jgi:hypothetical protein